jgi:hypothetical protein
MDSIGDWIDDISSGLIDVLTQLAPILSKLGEIAGLAAFVVGIVALFPATSWLAPLALTLSAISLGATYLAAVGETGSWTTALTTTDVIVGAASLALGGVATRAISRMSRMGLAEQGFMGAVLPAARTLLGESDDVMRFTLAANTYNSYTFASDFSSSLETMWNLPTGWHTDDSPVATD